MLTGAAADRMVIRRLHPDEWGQLREIRLRALLHEPGAFGTARRHDLSLAEDDWRETLTVNAWLAASTGQHAMDGIVAYFPTDTEPDGAPQLGSMWVHPRLRRSGLARRLCAAVVDLARGDGAEALGLWVIQGNRAASDIYHRLGFRASVDQKPAPRDPGVVMHRMLLPLVNSR